MPFITVPVDLALFLLRVIIAVIMLPNGYDKLKNLKEKGRKFPGGTPSAFLVGAGEAAGGLGLLAGVFSDWAALGLLIIMLGTIPFMFKWNVPFLTVPGKCGWDYNVLLIIGLLVLLALGPGAWVLMR